MRVLRAIFSGIGITILVALALSALLWFLGGFLAIADRHPFDGVLGRLIGLAVLWIGALLVVLVILLRRQKRETALADEIVESPEDTGSGTDDGLVAEELGEMRGKLRDTLAQLRKTRGGRKLLHEMPWYVLIGPPGAGKTTAIVNSGLRFPLAEDPAQAAAVGGVGGTRNCDWWFSDEAVLVDTAGRYTTQESDAEADSAAWQGFLRLIRKHRPRQPINGAVVAISLSDLSLTDAETQKGHAAAIRRRLSELREKLGVRFPVYVLFTKADLIAGFNESFEGLGREPREQVWGFTLPLPQGRGDAPLAERAAEEFDLLLERLNRQSLHRMQAESDPQRRALIAGFPGQLASLRQVALDFLGEIFAETKLDKRQLLRGVYLTSGTQEGTPIDRLMMGMARTFGIGRQAIGAGRGQGRAYFLTGLFRRVMFPEAGLVAADDRVERRYRWTRRAAFAAAILAAIGMGALWYRSYTGNAALIAEAEASVDRYRQAAAAIPAGEVGDSDLPLVVPALNELRSLAMLREARAERRLGWGLYQGQVIGNEAGLSYRAALNQHLLPRLILRAQERLQASINDPEALYEALKVYLTLGLVGPPNGELIRDWMQADWEAAYPGASRIALRQDLAAHLDALLSQPMEQIDLNADLVTQVQGVLTRMPLAARVYNGIIASSAAAELPDWRLTDIGGPAIDRAFIRSSGKPLNEGIDGIFTRRGFYEVFLEEALSVARRLQDEAWVLGPAGEQVQSEAALMKMSRDVLQLYYDDYTARYDAILSEIDVVPLQSLPHAVEVTNVLSGSASPIRNVLQAVADETRLTQPPPDPQAAIAGTEQATEDASARAGAGGGVVAAALINRHLSVQTQIFLEAVSQDPGGRPIPPGAYVEDRFAWLHRLVARQEGQPSPLDLLMDTLRAVYEELNNSAFSGGPGAKPGEAGALTRFRQATQSLEGPLARWASQITVGSSGIAADGTRAGINAKWQSEILPFCEQVVGDAYPFNRKARNDVAIQDFARLFGNGGLIDAFFKENLAPIVDVRARPWAWKSVNGADLGIPPAILEQFQHAAEIREAFFSGGAAPSVPFQVTPEALDPKAQGILLEIDGQEVAFRHADGQPKPIGVTWPGPVGLARVTFSPPKPGSESSFGRDGPWAWFRLLDAVELRKTNASDRKRMIFNVGGRIAIFQLQSGSVLNPFALPALSKFSCPKSF